MLKIAIAVASSDAPPEAFVVWRGFETSIVKARQFGYDGVELALRDAQQIDLPAVRSLLRDQGLACPCISTGQVFASLGLHFTTADSARRAQAIEVFRGLIDVAAELGAMVNIGRVRGFIEKGQTRQDSMSRCAGVIAQLAQYADSLGVALLLEPVNRYEINFINNLAEGCELLDAAGAKNVMLMPDLFHMNIEDPTLGGELRRHAARIGYIHFADSNRRAPGQGHIDFPEVLTALRESLYKGWATVEILPFPDPDVAARQAIEFLRPLMEMNSRA
jgi:5-keto-L-gluconate epimerase